MKTRKKMSPLKMFIVAMCFIIGGQICVVAAAVIRIAIGTDTVQVSVISSTMEYDVFTTSENRNRCVLLVMDDAGNKFHIQCRSGKDADGFPESYEVYVNMKPGNRYNVSIFGETKENTNTLWPETLYPEISWYEQIDS
jgi:hypothetical protein